MKRLIPMLLLAAMLFGPLGKAPAPARASTGSPADLMPAATSLYVEVDTSDLMGVIDTLVDLAGRAGLPASRQMVLAALDSGLRDMLQSASFEQDVLPWLGPSMAAAVFIPEDLPAGQNPFPVQEGLFIATVNDDAGARRFLDGFMGAVEARGVTLERTETTLKRGTVTRYSYEPSNFGAARMPGYLVFGPLSSLNMWFSHLDAGGPALSEQAGFAAIWSQFRPGSLIKGYVSSGFFQTMLASVVQNQSFGPQERAILGLFRAFQAFGFALRGEGRALAFDLIGSIDAAREAQVMEQLGLPPLRLNPNSGWLAARIPANTVAAIDWGDLAGLIHAQRNDPAFEQLFAMWSSQLKAATQIDLEQDVLAWLGGEFALYASLDAGQRRGLLPVPSDTAQIQIGLVVEVTDPAAARGFLDKLNRLIDQMASQPGGLQRAELDDDYYAISVDSTSVAYGLVNDVFVLAFGDDPRAAQAAARGEDTLAQTPFWQHVTDEIPDLNQQVLLLNFAPINELLGLLGGPPENSPDAEQFKVLLNALEAIEGGLIYGSDRGAGNVVATVAILLREALK